MTIIPTVEGAGNDGGVPSAWGGRRLGRGRWRLAGRVVAGVLRRRRARARGGRAGGARVAGGEGGRGVGGERGRRRERVSVSEREKKEKPSVWLSSPSLPSARDAALGKDFFIFKICFAECQIGDTRQRRLLCQGHSAKINLHFFAECHPGALGKAYFAECQPADTRQSIFLFFCFGHQTFCCMFLNYVDLHVSFWDNYNSVCNS
jgi:hypothetical protein